MYSFKKFRSQESLSILFIKLCNYTCAHFSEPERERFNF